MKKWILLFFAALLLAGCWDVREPERMYYAHGIGVDYVDGQFEVYVQVIDFTNIAKSEQPQPDISQAEVGHGRGETVDEAIFDLYHSLDMRLFWGHLSFVIFSKPALEDGRLNTIVNTLTRYRETRYRTWMYATEDKISDVMLVTPVLNKAINLSSISTPLNSFTQESYVAPVNFRQFIIRLNEPNHTVAIPYIGLKENWESEKEKKEKIEYRGMAVVSQNDLIDILMAEEIKGTQLMTNETERTQLTYFFKDEPVTVVVRDLEVDVKSKVEQDSFRFDVTVKMNVFAYDFDTEITKEEIEATVKKEVEKRIKETYRKALEKDIDIYRLTNYAYRQNVKAWKKVEKNGRIPLKEDAISSVEVYIKKLSAARKEFTETIKE